MSLLTAPVGGCIGYLQHNQVSDAGQLENRLGGLATYQQNMRHVTRQWHALSRL